MLGSAATYIWDWRTRAAKWMCVQPGGSLLSDFLW